MPSADSTAFWCYRCTRFVSPLTGEGADSLFCPRCSGGFVQEIESHTFPQPQRLPTYSPNHRPRRRRVSATASVAAGVSSSNYNPVVVFRGPATETESESQNAFEFFYDDGTGSGLRPLPSTMSEFLLGSGFDQLLEQLAQLELAGFSRPENPPASKAAVESMPRVAIGPDHLLDELHCAVCKEQFERCDEARQMPCKHMYHQECILPWLATRNSCPVCRHELPTEASHDHTTDGAVGMTIWRLPGGGFAVGRFRREREDRERELALPAVYTEVDEGFVGESGGGGGGGGVPRGMHWGMRSSGSSERGNVFGRMVRNLLRFLRGSEGSERRSFRRSQSSSESVIGRHVRRRRNRTWVMEE